MAHGNNLNLLRFVAASAVVYGHSWPILGQPDPELFDKGVHGLGVMIFFALSGYLITLSWQKDPTAETYWVKRALRILPALTAMVLLVTFVVGPIVSDLPLAVYLSSGETWLYALRNMVLWTSYDLPGVFQTNPIVSVNNSLWTLPMEVTMYAATPAMIWLIGRHRVWAVIALTIAAFGALALYVRHPYVLEPITHATIYSYRLIDLCVYMPSYLTGVLFAVLRFDLASSRAKRTAMMVSGAALLWAQFVPNSYNLLLILLPVTTVTLVFGLARGVAPAWFTRMGDLSYGTFLWGFVVQQVLVWQMDGAITPLELAALSLPVSWCLGALSWHLVERPVLRWKPRGSSGRRSVGALVTRSGAATLAVGARLAPNTPLYQAGTAAPQH